MIEPTTRPGCSYRIILDTIQLATSTGKGVYHPLPVEEYWNNTSLQQKYRFCWRVVLIWYNKRCKHPVSFLCRRNFMRVAALILAHKNKEQLDRLISVLEHPYVDIYIHLDKKSKLSPDDFTQHNVRFTQKRIDIALFDFSMVDAELELIRTASSHGQYGYYILLSGQCYPLRHIDDIYTYLCKSYPKPLIEVISPNIVTKFARQFKYPHTLKRFRNASLSFLQKYSPTKSIYPYKYIPEGIVFAITLLRGIFVKSPKQRLHDMGITPYFGPQWWILPDAAIDGIIHCYENESFCNAMKDCFSCDETFFQTAIMRQADDFAIKLNEKGYYLNKKWFTIFSGGHPILLTEEHFEQLISSKMLFGRKFDINKDDSILDMLDKYSLEMYNKTIVD